MNEEGLVPVVIDGREIGLVRLGPEDSEKRRTINLALGVVQLPALLENFRPDRPMSPQARFLLVVRAYCEAMNDGKRNQLDENELVGRYMQMHGVGAALSHQVRRANADELCFICNKPYRTHKYERALLREDGAPDIYRLCNGDLVRLNV
jgi:hypothetical protein